MLTRKGITNKITGLKIPLGLKVILYDGDLEGEEEAVLGKYEMAEVPGWYGRVASLSIQSHTAVGFEMKDQSAISDEDVPEYEYEE